MPIFQALIELKKESGYTAAKSDVAAKYERLLDGLKNDCRTREIFFKGSLAAHIKGPNTFEAHLVDIFKSAFPETKTNDHILTVAEGALTVFISALLKHKAILHKISFYAHEHVKPHNKSNQKKLEEELLAFVKEDAEVKESSVQAKYKELYIKKIHSLQAVKKIRKVKKLSETGKLSKEERRKSEQEIAKSLPSIESALKKLAQENEDVVTNMDEVIDLFPDVEAAVKKLEKDPNGLIAKALQQKLEEYEILKKKLLLEVELKEKQEEDQKEWLIQYRKDLVKNLEATLNSVLVGNAGAATDITYSTTGGKVVEGHLIGLLSKENMWGAYEPAVKAAIKKKLEGLTITTPKKFNEDSNDSSFKEDLSTGTDLQSTFKSNLEGKTLKTSLVRSQLNLVYVKGDKLGDELINEHVKDITWSEINLSGTAKLHSSLDTELKELIKEVGNSKFSVSSVEAKAKEGRYQIYRLLVEEYIATLKLWGMGGTGEGTINSAWLDKWGKHFNANQTFVDKKVQFKKLNTTKQGAQLEAYTDSILVLIRDEYGVDYEVSPSMAETLCKEWFVVSGSKLDSYEKAEYVQKVYEAVSELAGLSVTFGSLGSAIKDVKKNSGQWNDWKDLFDKTDSAWNGFKKASDSMGLAAQAVGTAVDIGVAYKETKSYKESKGDRAWRESWKQKTVVGSIVISIGEIKNTKKDIEEYKTLEEKYFGKTNSKTEYKEDGELKIKVGETLDEKEQRAFDRAQRFKYAAEKLKKKYINKLLDFIGKVTSYVMLVLSLIPTGITQIIAAFLGILNGIQSLGRALYGWANYWYKRKKGTQGVERDKVAQALVDDAFCIYPVEESAGLDELLKNDACAMMWAAGVYKSDEIHDNLTVFTKGDINDSNYPIWESPLSRALENAVDLATRLKELADNKVKDTVRYMTTRIMIKEYMKDYLKST